MNPGFGAPLKEATSGMVLLDGSFDFSFPASLAAARTLPCSWHVCLVFSRVLVHFCLGGCKKQRSVFSAIMPRFGWGGWLLVSLSAIKSSYGSFHFSFPASLAAARKLPCSWQVHCLAFCPVFWFIFIWGAAQKERRFFLLSCLCSFLLGGCNRIFFATRPRAEMKRIPPGRHGEPLDPRRQEEPGGLPWRKSGEQLPAPQATLSGSLRFSESICLVEGGIPQTKRWFS